MLEQSWVFFPQKKRDMIISNKNGIYKTQNKQIKAPGALFRVSLIFMILSLGTKSYVKSLSSLSKDMFLER